MAGQAPGLPVCSALTESSSRLCDRQLYQSVKLLKHKTQGISACMQPKRAKKHRPHWVSLCPSTPPPLTTLPFPCMALCMLSFFPSLLPVSLELRLFFAAKQLEVQQICIIAAWRHKPFKEVHSDRGICSVIATAASEWQTMSLPLGVCLCIKI